MILKTLGTKNLSISGNFLSKGVFGSRFTLKIKPSGRFHLPRIIFLRIFLWCQIFFYKKIKTWIRRFSHRSKSLLQRFSAATSWKTSWKTFSPLLFFFHFISMKLLLKFILSNVLLLDSLFFFLSSFALNTFFNGIRYRFSCFTFSKVSLSTAKKKKLFFSISPFASTSHSNPAISLLCLRINKQFSQRQHTRVMKTPRKKKVQNHRHGECKKRKSTWRKENGENQCSAPENNTF